VAQIAITALSLPYLEHTHWTAQAAFVVSLLTGLLAVYYAYMVQQQLSTLHTSQEVLNWLTTAQVEDCQEPADREPGVHPVYRPIPSLASALLLTYPAQLLNWSLSFLLIGVGVYYGIVYTEDLGQLRGSNANLAVLVVYVCAAIVALGSYQGPLFRKELEGTPSARQSILDFRRHHKTPRRPTPDQDASGCDSPDAKPRNPCVTVIPDSNVKVIPQESSSTESGVSPRPADPWEASRARVSESRVTQAGMEKAGRLPASSQTHVESANDGHTSDLQAVPSARNSAEMQTILDALRASIAAQKASLHAQEMLMREYHKQSGSVVVT